VVVNDVSDPEIGFDSSENAVTILTADRDPRAVAQSSKEQIAGTVLDEVERLRATSREGAGGTTRAGTGSAAGV